MKGAADCDQSEKENKDKLHTESSEIMDVPRRLSVTGNKREKKGCLDKSHARVKAVKNSWKCQKFILFKHASRGPFPVSERLGIIFYHR